MTDLEREIEQRRQELGQAVRDHKRALEEKDKPAAKQASERIDKLK